MAWNTPAIIPLAKNNAIVNNTRLEKKKIYKYIYLEIYFKKRVFLTSLHTGIRKSS